MVRGANQKLTFFLRIIDFCQKKTFLPRTNPPPNQKITPIRSVITKGLDDHFLGLGDEIHSFSRVTTLPRDQKSRHVALNMFLGK